MAIIAKAKELKSFQNPPVGNHQAVCCGVWDLGLQNIKWQEQEKTVHQVCIGWELEEINDSGKRFVVYRKYTLTLHEKGSLCKDLTSWRGRPFTEEEKDGFDVEVLIGVNCLLNIIHSQSGNKTFANIAGVSPLPKTMIRIKPENKPDAPAWVLKLQANAVNKNELEGHVDAAEVSEDEEEAVPF